MTDKGFKSQLPLNLITNIIYFVINIIIGIWLVPFYISKLGIEGYGFIPLATTITFYASIITLSLNSAVSRYLTINIQKNDSSEANKTFNTSIIVSAVVSAAMLPVAFAISYYSDYIFKMPFSLIGQGRILFFMVFVSFLVTVLSNPFSATTYSLNRLDLSNTINIINVIVRTGFIVLLLYLFTPSLSSVGYSFLLAAIATFISSYFVCKKITPDLKINFSYYDRSKLSNLTKMSSWLMINQLGTMLFVNIDLIIVNLVFGAKSQGQYAALLQMSIMLRNLSFVVSRVTGPMVYITYAKNEIRKMVAIMNSSVKFMTIVLALPIGIMCGFAAPFLKVWLGADFVKFVPLLWLITGHLIINLGIQPLYAVSNAYNKVKIPGVVTLLLGIVNVLLALSLAYYTNLGFYAVAFAGAIVLTIKNGIFTPMYSAHVIRINKFIFLKPVLIGLMLTLVIFFSSYIFAQFISIQSWMSLLTYSGIIAVIFIPLIWLFIINRNEKEILKSMLSKSFSQRTNEPMTNEQAHQ